MAITYMTKEGYDRKMEELNYMETVKRPEISRAIAEARDKGDLSENAEYDAAKEAQGLLEMKIAQLKELVANARIIDESKLTTDEIQLQPCTHAQCRHRQRNGIHNRSRQRSRHPRQENRYQHPHCSRPPRSQARRYCRHHRSRRRDAFRNPRNRSLIWHQSFRA